MKSAANKSYNSCKGLVRAESPRSVKDFTPKQDCLESLPKMGISQLSDIPIAEVWDGNTAQSCHKMRAGQAGRAVLSMYLNLGLTEG